MEYDNKDAKRIIVKVFLLNIVIMLLLLLFNFIADNQKGVQRSGIRITLSLVLFYMMFKGFNWARWVSCVFYFFGGIYGLFIGFKTILHSPLGIIFFILSLVYFGSFYALTAIPAIQEYFRYARVRFPKDDESQGE